MGECEQGRKIVDTIDRDRKFRKELEELINKYSMENHSNTADYILADYLMNCLESYHKAVIERDSCNYTENYDSEE